MKSSVPNYKIFGKIRSIINRLYTYGLIQKLVHRSRIISRLVGKKFVGLEGLDQKLAKIITYKDGFFVELGANDGILYSNTLHFELFQNWTGLLIEPSPVEFKKLRRNRGKKSTAINAACVDFDYRQENIELIYSGLMTIDLSPKTEITDIESHAKTGRQFIDVDNYRFTAKALTLTSILDSAGAPNVMDLLSLDVEGSELNVLNGFDFDKYKFKYVLIETRSFKKIDKYLTQRNYRFIESVTAQDFLYAYHEE